MEKIVSDPVGDSASIWTSISTLSSRIRHIEDKITANLNTKKVEAIESELDAMLEVMEEMRVMILRLYRHSYKVIVSISYVRRFRLT